jgi:hypothetical protein
VKEKVIALIGKLNSESTGDDSIKFIKE